MPKIILILTTNPTDTVQLDLTQKIEEIDQKLQHPQHPKQFEFKLLKVVTPDAIHRALLDYQPHFVHFAGHGTAEQGIILENEQGKSQPLSTETLTQIFEPHAQIECVTLNACFSVLQASALVKQSDYVIGMNQPMNDAVAIDFAISFYNAIATTKSIETAFAKGHDTISDHFPTLEESQKPVLKKSYQQTVFHLPIVPNPFLTGREGLLRQIQETLYFCQAAALTGLEGIGKTQTVAHYAYLHSYEYQAVLWSVAETEESLKSGWVEIAHSLDLPEKQADKQQDIIQAVKLWLQTHHDWLLILDNVDNINLVSAFLGEDLPRHHLLLLTTGEQITESIAQQLPISVLSLEESTLFLLRRALDKPQGITEEDYSPSTYSEASELAQTLDNLPLALEQAGAYIQETQCSFAEYLERYHTDVPQLLAKQDSQEYSDAVAKNWLLSFDKIVSENAIASDILSLCAFLHPDKIVEEIFADMDTIAFEEALAIILKYSLLHREPNTKTLSIHRLGQLILKQKLDETEQRAWAEQAVRAVNRVFPSDRIAVSQWNQCERLLPCAQTSATLIEKWQLELTEAALLLNQTAYYLYSRAEYTQAKPLYEQALAMNENLYGKEHPSIATSLNNLAELYRAQGAYEQALPLYKRALSIKEKLYGKEHSSIATSLNNLAELYRLQGAYKQALPLFEQALAILEKVHGQMHPDVAQAINNLAELYRTQEKYEQAVPLFRQAVAIKKKVYGKEHPEVVKDFHNLAELYETQGEFEQALHLFKRALMILEKIHGKEHPEVAQSLNNLAELYSGEDMYKSALPFSEQALAIFEKVYGKEHPLVATSLNTLAMLHCGQGTYKQSLQLHKRALAIREKFLGKEHPDVAQSIHNLAGLYDAQDLPEQAVPLYKQALAIREKVYGPEHLKVAISLNNLALMYESQGQYEEALPLYERTLEIDEKIYGKDHPEVAMSLNNLAGLYESLDEYEKAKPLYERSLNIINKSFQSEHSNVQFVSMNYAELLKQMEKAELAQPGGILFEF